jgi:hypothetical protein
VSLSGSLTSDGTEKAKLIELSGCGDGLGVECRKKSEAEETRGAGNPRPNKAGVPWERRTATANGVAAVGRVLHSRRYLIRARGVVASSTAVSRNARGWWGDRDRPVLRRGLSAAASPSAMGGRT